MSLVVLSGGSRVIKLNTGRQGRSVPPGGAAGQVLVKASDADFDYTWATVTTGGAIVVSPANTVAPVISGSPRQGQTLTASTGAWTGSPSSYAYRWRQNGVAISGATSSSYVVTSGDIGQAITVTVTATGAGGSNSTTSAPVYPLVFPVDEVGGTAPVAAYGTRQLVSSYSGPSIRVRRSSDNAELDIHFTTAGVVDTSALDAFLSGAVGYVKTVYDQSGNGNDATQTTTTNQPIIDTFAMRGTRVLRFQGGASEALVLPFTVDKSALSMVAVGAPRNSDLINGAVQLGADHYVFWQDFYRGTGFNAVRPQTNLSVFGYASSSSGVDWFLNESTGTGTGQTTESLVGGYWGSMPALGGSYASHSEWAGLVFFGRRLNSTELSNGRTAMHTAFGISATKTRTIAVFGDSIAAGTIYDYGVSAIPRAAQLLDSSIRIYNEAAGGSNTTGEQGVYTAWKGYVSPTNVVVAMQGGTNDIGGLGDDAPTIYNRLKTFWAGARSDGAKVIACTILPCAYYNSSQNTRLAALNTLIKSDTSLYDVLNDLAADTIMGTNNWPGDLTYYGDGLHPTPAGQEVLKALWKTAFDAALAL